MNWRTDSLFYCQRDVHVCNVHGLILILLQYDRLSLDCLPFHVRFTLAGHLYHDTVCPFSVTPIGGLESSGLWLAIHIYLSLTRSLTLEILALIAFLLKHFRKEIFEARFLVILMIYKQRNAVSNMHAAFMQITCSYYCFCF